MLRYAITIFLGAFLLFLVQPLIGKYILPWFGGGAGVWTVCLLFFQLLLVVGYAYAHLTTRWLSPRSQMWVHCGLLIVCLAFLPIIPDAAWKPQSSDDPTWRILALLTVCVGAPYTALAATGPLLQAWFTRTHAGVSPYRLYALSNAGSLLALLGYPFAMEPTATRPVQAWIWSGGFIAFAAICGYCAIRAVATSENATPMAIPSASKSLASQQPQPKQRAKTFLWLLLPACASVMLLAVTSHLSQEVAPVPFLWVVPLAVYLLTFIIAFEWPRVYYRPVFIGAILLSGVLLLIMLTQPYISIPLQVTAYSLVLFACCMTCHGELYRLRPEPQRLTSYYLAIAVGGALGGAFVAIAAPLLFSSFLELYVGLFGSMALLMACLFIDPRSIFYRGQRRQYWLVLIAAMVGVGFALNLSAGHLHKNTVLSARNFYGVLTLKLHNAEKQQAQSLELKHGHITHGVQIIDPAKPQARLWQTMYFAQNTGVGMVMRLFPKTQNRRVGIVGLGVGTLAAYGNRGDVYRFYEINPEVERLAREHFFYLGDSAATVDVVMGDARLMLEAQEPQAFDILVLDAFSGDAIPVHLLTKEAFELYQRHLAPDGVIAVHVSNRYLDLHPVVHRLGHEAGFEAVFVNTQEDKHNFIADAHWVLLTRNQAILNAPEIQQVGFKPPGIPNVALWTDDHANLLAIVRSQAELEMAR